MNFINHNRQYDTFTGLPDWAKRTLSEHSGDPRGYLYSLMEME